MLDVVICGVCMCVHLGLSDQGVGAAPNSVHKFDALRIFIIINSHFIRFNIKLKISTYV